MTATERVEAVNAARHTLIQAATALVVIGGVVFTAQNLWYTAQSLDASRQAQLTAEQGQITDRFDKAMEQFGSTKLDVRLGGMYALERLAQDSPRDRQTVYDMLAMFVREHDPKASVKAKDLPGVPATDVQTALTIIGRRSARSVSGPDLALIRIPGVALYEADLRNANLSHANLSHANLSGANLSRADLGDVVLAGADLDGAHLFDASFWGADLRDADLHYADLRDANLTNADLRGATLSGVDLRGAVLSGADLRGAYLENADLRGAILSGGFGFSEKKVREIAIVDDATHF
ncbi:pentapeptide repeat-containing protein [[Actinomadura] parvosata]|uniref:pentapeptide repeat-containing protein n=1 Tax=[Actinomadura] parvosata TaxID=1955412 RepID=UPI00406D1764